VTGLPGRLNSASDSIGDEMTSRDLRIGVGLWIATSFFIVVFFLRLHVVRRHRSGGPQCRRKQAIRSLGHRFLFSLAQSAKPTLRFSCDRFARRGLGGSPRSMNYRMQPPATPIARWPTLMTTRFESFPENLPMRN
jgi:hypothetical protein